MSWTRRFRRRSASAVAAPYASRARAAASADVFTESSYRWRVSRAFACSSAAVADRTSADTPSAYQAAARRMRPSVSSISAKACRASRSSSVASSSAREAAVSAASITRAVCRRSGRVAAMPRSASCTSRPASRQCSLARTRSVRCRSSRSSSDAIRRPAVVARCGSEARRPSSSCRRSVTATWQFSTQASCRTVSSRSASALK